ncbi:nuclease-related domain-containing protein [Peribacillus sp. SCS-37]|uniref:nuclease-related domain-containing protein n=1 Tax=Paraperibacillus esterisolvens TaxID=3115296 RepID=UPI0039064AB6
MIYKLRTEPPELSILKSLQSRTALAQEDMQLLLNLQKGHEGEMHLDSLLEQLDLDCLLLNDLRLMFTSTSFQIDSLIITSESIFLLEAKNYEGEYYYEAGKLYKHPRYEVANPLHQLHRTETLIRQLLKKLGCTIPISSSVIFTHPEFTLFQAPTNTPIVLPTSLNRFIVTLNKIPSRLTEKHRQIAKQLTAMHIKDYPHKALPSYTFEEIRKGIQCAACKSFVTISNTKEVICEACMYKETIRESVLRMTREITLLFPEKKITSVLVSEWCKEQLPIRKIQKILELNYKKVGLGRGTYYEKQ